MLVVYKPLQTNTDFKGGLQCAHFQYNFVVHPGSPKHFFNQKLEASWQISAVLTNRTFLSYSLQSKIKTDGCCKEYVMPEKINKSQTLIMIAGVIAKKGRSQILFFKLKILVHLIFM